MKRSNAGEYIRISAPELRDDPAFCAWMKKASGPEGSLATWHRKGEPLDGSDCFIWVEKGESSDSDMPQSAFEKIIACVGATFTGLVWIDFLGDSPREIGERILENEPEPTIPD